MALSDRINEELKQAMKAKNEVKLRTLRAIKSAILLAQTEKGGSNALDEDTELKLLQRLAKQRRESLDIYEKQGREDLATTEREELEVIEEFLPKQLSEDDVRKAVKEVIAETGAKSAADLGKVMPLVIKKLAGQADGKVISAIVREQLS